MYHKVEQEQKQHREETKTYLAERHQWGEAWMWCQDCGAKLYSFDGTQDASQKCPNLMRSGVCV